MNNMREQQLIERKAKLQKMDELRSAGATPGNAAKEAGFRSLSAAYSARYMQKESEGTKSRGYTSRKKKPENKDVIVVNSDDTKEEEVKIVVMKGPSAVIQKIAEALGGVL
jgi:hypothetical protein